MTRALLSIALCAGCLALGLLTSFQQAENHARAARLDEVKRRCDLLEAGNEALRYRIRRRRAELDRAEGAPRSQSTEGAEG
jgi:hypothetical protein